LCLGFSSKVATQEEENRIYSVFWYWKTMQKVNGKDTRKFNLAANILLRQPILSTERRLTKGNDKLKAFIKVCWECKEPYKRRALVKPE